MCYGLIKNHEGWINLHSDVGVGTTFEIYLPMIKAKEEGKHREVFRLCDMPQGSETILLTDETLKQCFFPAATCSNALATKRWLPVMGMRHIIFMSKTEMRCH